MHAFFAFLLTLVAAAPASAIQLPIPASLTARYRPDYNWRTVRAGRFVIYYVAGHEDIARRVVQLTTEVGRDVTGYLGVDPPECPVILAPAEADFNGFYMPFPNRVTLFETPIADELMLATFGTHHSDLLDLLFTHEYTHFAHKTMDDGPAGFFMRLFGSGYAIPNFFASPWQSEGLATYVESRFNDAGRLKSPLFRAKLLAHVRDGTMWRYPINGSLTSRSWPGGERVYLGGAFFTQYIDDRFGVGAMAKAAQFEADWLFPFTAGGVRHATRISIADLWSDYLAYLDTQAKKDEAAARSLGLPEGRPLIPTRDPFDSFAMPLWTPSGTIFAVRSGLERDTALVEIAADGRILRDTPAPHYHAGRIALDGDSVLFSATFPVPAGGVTDDDVDLVRTDLATGDVERLTDGASLYEASFSPDRKRLVAQKRRGNWMDLVVADASQPAAERPLAGAPNTSYFGPSWSPDGREILAAVKSGPRADLVLIDAASGRARTVFAADDAGDLSGRFACGGRYVVFASDRSGLWNIYAYDRNGATLTQLTSVASAALQPDVSPDCKQLVFTVVTGRGDELRVMPFAPSRGRVIPVAGGGPLGAPAPSPREAPLPEPGSIPLSAYLPFAHGPVIRSDEEGAVYGLALGGADPLYHNFYKAVGLYGTASRRPGYELTLLNRATWLDIEGVLRDGAVFGNTLRDDDDDRILRERGGDLSLHLPLLLRAVPTPVSLRSGVGMSLRHFSALEDGHLSKNRDTLVAATFELALRNARRTPPRSALLLGDDTLAFNAERSLPRAASELQAYSRKVYAQTAHTLAPTNIGWLLRAGYQRQDGAVLFSKGALAPRGYVDAGVVGDEFTSGTAEVHFPIAYPERGFSAFLLTANMLTLAAFVDVGEGDGHRYASGGLNFNAFGYFMSERFDEQRLSLTAGVRAGGEAFGGLQFNGVTSLLSGSDR